MIEFDLREVDDFESDALLLTDDLEVIECCARVDVVFLMLLSFDCRCVCALESVVNEFVFS